MSGLAVINLRALVVHIQIHPEFSEMLILTRRVDERILIGNDIVVCVLGIEGNRVRLGLDAPDNVTILREEIYSRNCGVAANDPNHGSSSQSNRM